MNNKNDFDYASTYPKVDNAFTDKKVKCLHCKKETTRKNRVIGLDKFACDTCAPKYFIEKDEPIKVSLFDHRLETCGNDRTGLEINCSCGAVFTEEFEDFYEHQKDGLNKQLNEYGIEVV